MKHVMERLRCALCGSVFTAHPGFKLEKYPPSVKATIALTKNYLGIPLYRLEKYQEMLGVPLKDSTQWEQMEDLANNIHPIFLKMMNCSAQGKQVYHDDTSVKILSLMKENKTRTDKERKGMQTTGIISEYQGHKICLFLSGRRHSGENMDDLMAKRSKDLPPVIRMCDALSSNLSTKFEEFLCKCVAHGRRKFYELHTFSPAECRFVLDSLGLVYHHDAITKEKKMSDQERLAYHKEHSAPLMEKLKQWIDAQLSEKKVEPSSSLGKAIKYMHNHWLGLTAFLRVPGAPLDNNIVERALKIIIRVRKNSLFYKTEHSAYVGGMLTSIIYTCVLAGENPFEYLVSCQENRSALFKAPQDWLPWNYRQTMEGVAQRSQSPPCVAA